jgi:hypothetical protein
MKGVTEKKQRQKGCPEEAGEEKAETLSHLPRSFQVFSSILEKAKETRSKHQKR